MHLWIHQNHFSHALLSTTLHNNSWVNSMQKKWLTKDSYLTRLIWPRRSVCMWHLSTLIFYYLYNWSSVFYIFFAADHQRRRSGSRERRVTIAISPVPPMPMCPPPQRGTNLTTVRRLSSTLIQTALKDLLDFSMKITKSSDTITIIHIDRHRCEK